MITKGKLCEICGTSDCLICQGCLAENCPKKVSCDETLEEPLEREEC